jgi:hypothetical protein
MAGGTRDPSLRLKNGFARDDTLEKSQTAPLRIIALIVAFERFGYYQCPNKFSGEHTWASF